MAAHRWGVGLLQHKAVQGAQMDKDGIINSLWTGCPPVEAKGSA